MMDDAITRAGTMATNLMRDAAESGASTCEIFELVSSVYRDALVGSDYSAGCPIGVAAQERHRDEKLRKTIEEAFDDWRDALIERLIAEGRDIHESHDLAQLTVASVEGALLMACIDRKPDPIDSIRRQVTPLPKRAY